MSDREDIKAVYSLLIEAGEITFEEAELCFSEIAIRQLCNALVLTKQGMWAFEAAIDANSQELITYYIQANETPSEPRYAHLGEMMVDIVNAELMFDDNPYEVVALAEVREMLEGKNG